MPIFFVLAQLIAICIFEQEQHEEKAGRTLLETFFCASQNESI